MASNKDAALYGVPRPKKLQGKEISSSTSISFTSQMSSLLASTDASTRTSSGRSRPLAKSNIFATHNLNAKKRAAKDLEPDDGAVQKHRADIGEVDDHTLHRSKRKMEEKARLYAAMKRGDYTPNPEDSREDKGLVDFDRKWAENEAEGGKVDTSSDEDSSSDAHEMVEYIDEFGRQRQGTRAEAAREERRKKNQGADEPFQFSARPAPPSNLIYGDTIQSAAFNPDEPIAAKMDDIARKRDKSLTPPPDLHYDANSEIRTKGVGFYSFSKDKEGRLREMEALERERSQTENTRADQQAKKEKRMADIADRKAKIRQQRSKKDADRFLDDLSGQIDPSR